MLDHKLGKSISYDRIHRQLTTICVNIKQQIVEDGASFHQNYLQIIYFLMSMHSIILDWKKKSLEGGSFHATAAIVIETPANNAL